MRPFGAFKLENSGSIISVTPEQGEACMGRQSGVIVVVLIMSLFAFDLAAAGQAQVTGSIVGRVTDESGAVLPGVTVTATSPALQVPQVVNVTTVQGDYRLTPLPIGTYEVVFTLTGFQTVRRETIRLTAGFIARIDVVLKVGAIEESITVAASPTVDVQSTGAVTVLTKETLEVVPSSRAGLISLMNQSPAVRSQMDIGGSQSNILPAMRVYGIGTQATSWLVLDGVVTTDAGQTGGGGSYFDYASFEEARMQTIANDVEVPNRGVNVNLIVKSGGNEFHGTMSWEQTNDTFQGSNLDDTLKAQGITAPNNLVRRFYGGGDVGGRIVRNKLWFYTGLRGRMNRENPVLHRFEYSAWGCKKRARSPDDRMGRAVAHFSLSRSMASSRMPRARRRTALIVVFNDSTTPNRTG